MLRFSRVLALSVRRPVALTLPRAAGVAPHLRASAGKTNVAAKFRIRPAAAPRGKIIVGRNNFVMTKPKKTLHKNKKTSVKKVSGSYKQYVAFFSAVMKSGFATGKNRSKKVVKLWRDTQDVVGAHKRIETAIKMLKKQNPKAGKSAVKKAGKKTAKRSVKKAFKKVSKKRVSKTAKGGVKQAKKTTKKVAKRLH